MTARPGRGRPPVFGPTQQTAYLAAVAAGIRPGQAAATVGISRNVPAQHARTNPTFATALADAKAAGRQKRIDGLPHDEYRYNHHGCRCQPCTRAASAARAARPDRQPAPPPAQPNRPAEVAKPARRRRKASSFSLARAS